MTLQSNSFRGDAKLEAAAASNPGHITPNASGLHVSKIQRALIQLDGARIEKSELDDGRYGDSTTVAVVKFKEKREIINFAYEKKVDPIVGIMTMARLDKELVAKEKTDPGFIFLSDTQKETVKAAIARAKQMLDVAVQRLRNITHSVVAPHNAAYYETKLDILNVFRTNLFLPDDLPIPDAIMQTLRRRLGRGVVQPTAGMSPVDAFNSAFLLQNYKELRASLDQDFRKEFYTMGKFGNDALMLFEAFVSSAGNFKNTTMYFRPQFFNADFSADHRAVTLAHERAHTIFRAAGHPGTGDNPFCVAPHAGDPNVQDSGQALSNPYCYEWLLSALQPNYSPRPFLEGCVVTGHSVDP